MSAFKTEIGAGVKTGILILFFVVTIGFFFVVSLIAEKVKEKLWPERLDNQYMKHAFLHIKNLGSNRQEVFQEYQGFFGSEDTDEFMVFEIVRDMQLIVQSCYSFFDSAFNKTGELIDDIKFEATFMTKSYIDKEITIPCSANKENRTPTSMIFRKDNPHIFDTTETAKVYRAQKPTMILVEDTADADYSDTYANQKNRIKSTVVLPVLSHENKLLGTLVVHCDRAGFFRRNRYRFWNELLEIFSVEIGYQKLLLDYYIEKNPAVRKPF